MEDLDDLEEWSDGKGMKFNGTKCTVMHVGTNKNFCHKPGAHHLEMREEEKDPGA